MCAHNVRVGTRAICLPCGSVDWTLFTRIAQQHLLTQKQVFYLTRLPRSVGEVPKPANAVPSQEHSHFPVCLLGKRHIGGPTVQKLLVAFSAVHSQMQPELHEVCIPSEIHQDMLTAGLRKYFRSRYRQKRRKGCVGHPKLDWDFTNFLLGL